MEKKENKNRLAGVPVWALLLITLFVSYWLWEILDKIQPPLQHLNIFSLIIYALFHISASSIICKLHPKSIWYTPFICNAFVILTFISEDFSNPEWPVLILLSACIILSVIGAFVGARIGRRKLDKQNN